MKNSEFSTKNRELFVDLSGRKERSRYGLYRLQSVTPLVNQLAPPASIVNRLKLKTYLVENIHEVLVSNRFPYCAIWLRQFR